MAAGVSRQIKRGGRTLGLLFGDRHRNERDICIAWFFGGRLSGTAAGGWGGSGASFEPRTGQRWQKPFLPPGQECRGGGSDRLPRGRSPNGSLCHTTRLWDHRDGLC